MEVQKSAGASEERHVPRNPTGTLPPKGGKGESGHAPLAISVTNDEFMRTVIRNLPDGAVAVVCSKRGDPGEGGWTAEAAVDVDRQCPADRNNYFNCSSFFRGEDGGVEAKKVSFAAYHVVVLDDVGTKVDLALLAGVVPTWIEETSPANYQFGFVFEKPLTDPVQVGQLQNAIVARGLCDPGATGSTRWSRLPVAINGKPKHRVDGQSFRCRVEVWNAAVTYSFDELVEALGLQLAPLSPPFLPALRSTGELRVAINDDVFALPALENPVVTRLRERGLYKHQLGPGKHDITW